MLAQEAYVRLLRAFCAKAAERLSSHGNPSNGIAVRHVGRSLSGVGRLSGSTTSLSRALPDDPGRPE